MNNNETFLTENMLSLGYELEVEIFSDKSISIYASNEEGQVLFIGHGADYYEAIGNLFEQYHIEITGAYSIRGNQ